MPEPFTVTKWFTTDGSLHDTEAEARDWEARSGLIQQADAVLARLGARMEAPPALDEDREQRQWRMAFNSGALAAIEAAIKAGQIKGVG